MTSVSQPLFSRSVTLTENPGSTGTIDTVRTLYAALDINLAAITGGTSPTVTFSLSRRGTNGLWYPVWTGSALTAPGTTSINLGPDTATPAVFTDACRIDWAFGGVAPPASVTFGLSLAGRD